MSELKVIDVDKMADVRSLSGQFYRKSEADKVIAERDKEIAELKSDYKEACDRLQTANLIKDEQLAATRHQKSMRCLYMADKCVVLCQKSKDLYRWAEDEKLEQFYNHKIEFFARWHERWLELAEKFKEAK